MSSECFCPSKQLHFTEAELTLIAENEVPRHIGIIMDGNRRWAKKRILSNIINPLSGHWAGAQALTPIVEAACELGIKILTVYGFSTENWSRSPKEIETIFGILKSFLIDNREKMCTQGVRFDVIGDLTPFPDNLKEEIQKTRQETEHCEVMRLVIALNYGGRDEICRVMRHIYDEIDRGAVLKTEISEELISRYLDTASFGDPDLLIRTSGEMRISNFLLWQLAYTEIYITNVLWPDFTPRELFNAVLEFQKRQRRQGR